MNKSIVIGAVLIVAAGLGYYQFSYVPGQQAAQEAATAAEAAKAAEAAAAKAAEEAKAAEAAAAAKAAEEAKAAEAAAAAAAAAATTAAAALSPAALLDPANFDAAKVAQLIDASTLPDATKVSLKAAVDAAVANPALLQSALDQVKAALGL